MCGCTVRSAAEARPATGHIAKRTSPALDERPVRFFAVQVGDEVRVCFDACEICGDKGYFEDGTAVVCRNCTSPIVRTSLGRTGGCNPIPLAHRAVETPEGPRLEISAVQVREVIPRLGGR